MADSRKIISLVALAVVAVVIIALIMLVKKITNKSKKPSRYPSVPPKDSPYISVEYRKSGSLLDDGKCGWLDIESALGGKETVALNFKNTPHPFFIPLSVGTYRITYRSKGKAAVAAEGIMSAINESSGAMGAFSNAVYKAGVGAGQLSSVVVDVNTDFVMKLACATDGFNGSCQVLP